MAVPSVITSGVLTVGVDASPPPPMQLGDPSTPDFHGYEVDLVQEVADRLGLSVQYQSALWSEILAQLDACALDLVCTAATITPERRARFAIGHPYLDLQLVAVVRGDEAFAGCADLIGKTFAVRAATFADEYVRRELEPSSLVTTEFNDEAYAALEAGQVSAIVDDGPIAAWYVAQRHGLRVLCSIPGTTSQYAMMFARQNRQLAEAIDEILDALFADGTVARLRERWFATVRSVSGDAVGTVQDSR